MADNFDNFKFAFNKFVDGVQELNRRSHASMNYSGQHVPKIPKIDYIEKKKYILVVRDNSAYAFVDKVTGDIFKPASYKSPAKHARGNIYDESNGLARMGVYGPQYLK